MAWITLVASNVLDRLAGDELFAYEQSGGNEDGDRLTGILSQVTTLVRGKALSCSENIAKAGATGTIPDELLWAAVTIARQSLINSLPTAEGEADPRRDELDRANRQLDDAAECKLRIESSTGTITSSVGVFGGETLLDF